MTMPRVKVTGPDELIQMVPYLFGFHPNDSVVAVALKGGMVEVSCRTDLGEGFDQFAAVVDRLGVDKLMFVGFGDKLAEVKRALAAAVSDATVPVADAIWVVDGRRGSLMCTDPTCCPPGGVPVSTTPSAGVVAMIAAGRLVAPTRDTVVGEITPAAADDALQELCARASGGPLPIADLRGVDVTFSVAARLAEAVADIAGRDAAWLYLEHADVEVRRALASQLREAARRVPRGRRVPVLFLAAWAAWRLGDNVRADTAVRALRLIDPGYSAGQMLETTLQAAVDPRVMPLLPMPDTMPDTMPATGPAAH